MKEEIFEAVKYLCQYVSKYGKLNEIEIKDLEKNLTQILIERYNGHWYETKPCKGQAYRCIRIRKNEDRDPVIECLLNKCSNYLTEEKLNLPNEFTLWIDPGEVSCRIGESPANTFIIAHFDVNNKATSSSSSSSSIPTKQQKSTLSYLSLPFQPSQQIQQQTFELNENNNNNFNENNEQKLTYDLYSCSPCSSTSSTSSLSFSSNASDGTHTPISYYGMTNSGGVSLCGGDSASERSETPSSINSSFNEPQTMHSTINTIQPSVSPSNASIQPSVSPSSQQQSYCGYVESFPYYYKLNRLYNALAIQKMQQDQLRKTMIRSKLSTNINNNSQQTVKQTSTPKNHHNHQSPTHQTQQRNFNQTQGIQRFNTHRMTPAINIPNNIQQNSFNSTSPSTLFQQYQQSSTSPSMLNNHSQGFLQSTINSAAAAAVVPSVTSSLLPTNGSQNSFDPMNWIRGPDLVKSKN